MADPNIVTLPLTIGVLAVHRVPLKTVFFDTHNFWLLTNDTVEGHKVIL